MENKYPLFLEKIVQSKSYALFLFKAENKQFPIYTQKNVGEIIQEYLSNKKPERPRTFDCFSSVLHGFDIDLFQTVLYDEQENVYRARLFFQKQNSSGILEILDVDARPSDALTLSIIYNKPLFVSESVFQKGMEQ